MMRAKEFHFPLDVTWRGGRRVGVRVGGKHDVDVAPPPVFKGTEPHVWSPEDLFVAAVASCLAVTFTGLAERNELELCALDVGGDGVCGTRDDGRFGFTRVSLRLLVVVRPGEEEKARELAERAEATCLVAASISLPVETTIDVEASGSGPYQARPPELARASLQ